MARRPASHAGRRPKRPMTSAEGRTREARAAVAAERTEELLDHLAAEPPRLAEVADALLTHYYDALYDSKAAKRAEVSDVVRDLVCDTGDASAIAPLILDAAEKLK